jgi:hypothetical protein
MESLITWLLTNFTFFASGLGILTIGAIALLMLFLWEWRSFLVGLCVIQLGIVVLVTHVHQVELKWAQVQILVTTLSAAMLFLSACQIRFALPYQRPGSWFIRLVAVMLLVVCWRIFDLDLTLPVVAPPLTQLFLWLVVCALITLGLSDAPLSTAVALSLWFIPVQAFIQILLPEFRLFVLIGIVQLLSALACSYLMLAARLPETVTTVRSTDMTFPSPRRAPRRPLPSLPELPKPTPRLLPTGGRQQPVAAMRNESTRREPPVAPREAS